MGYVLTIVFALISIPFISLLIRFNKNIRNNYKDKSITDIENPDDSIKTVRKQFTKTEIEDKLNKLADAPLPKQFAIGAMCYEMAAVKLYFEYVCPICGERTLYSSTEGSYIPEYTINCRKLINDLPKEQFQLDESELCKKCHPTIERPSICLIVKYPDNGMKKTCPISGTDLKIISEFINGKIVHREDNGAEEPLKDYIEKLEEIFDIKNK